MQIQSPSGRALFEFPQGVFPKGASYVDVVTCFAAEAIDIQPGSEGTTAASGGQIGLGATTAYKNSTFTWTLTPYNDPFGFRFLLCKSFLASLIRSACSLACEACSSWFLSGQVLSAQCFAQELHVCTQLDLF